MEKRPLSPVRLRIARLLFEAGAPVWSVDLAKAEGIPHGTVYTGFRFLYDLGWAIGVTVPQEGAPARVLYRLTDEGRKQVAALIEKEDKGS